MNGEKMRCDMEWRGGHEPGGSSLERSRLACADLGYRVIVGALTRREGRSWGSSGLNRCPRPRGRDSDGPAVGDVNLGSRSVRRTWPMGNILAIDGSEKERELNGRTD